MKLQPSIHAIVIALQEDRRVHINQLNSVRKPLRMFIRFSSARLRRTMLVLSMLSPAVLSGNVSSAWAQSESGRAAVTGRVTDATGAVIPKALITVTDSGTQQTRTVSADGAGLFSFPGLMVGTYTLKVTANGFAETRIDALTLSVGQTADLPLVLAPAGSANTVTVTTDADLIGREQTDNATLINNDLVEDLPTRGRNFTDFALLTPGISQELDRFGLVVNGQRSGNGNISIDGVDFNDPLQNGQRGGPESVFFFPQVAVREFQVVRTGLTAEVGRTNSGFLNVVTKSGTNRLHGEAFYTNRNPYLTWPDALGDPEATNNQNQFGGGIGGALIHDRLFYFVGVEKTQFEVPYFVRFNSCPTAGYYDQTGLNPNCSLAAQLAANPGTTASAYQPLPAFITAQEVSSFGYNSPLASSGRLDWQVSPRNTAMLQYMSTFLSNVAFGSSGIQANAASNNTLYAQQSQAVIAGVTTVLGSNRSNDVRIQAVYDNRQQVPVSTAPEVDIGDLGNFGGNSGGTNLYRAIREEAIDNYSWLLGRHALRFGVDINIEPETQVREDFANGLWTIDTFQDYLKVLPVAQGGMGQAPVNAAGCGAISNACAYQFEQTLGANGTEAKFTGTQREFAGYVQDNFHVLPRVTLNLGFRYEAQLQPQGTPNPAIPGTGVVPNDVSMYQPRFGLAWDARGTGKTIVRLSTGLFDARTPGYILARDFTDNGLQTQTINSTYDQSILTRLTPYTQRFGSLPVTNVINEIYTNDAAFRNPRSYQVAASVEQQLTKTTAFFIGFTQNETWKLQHRLNTNLFQPTVDAATLYPVFPVVNPITNIACTYQNVTIPCHPNANIAGLHVNYSTAHSTYRSLIAQVRGNLTRKLQGTANFTWASSRDDDSNERDYGRELALDSLCVACYNRGYSKQDIRNQFNLNGLYRLPYRFTFSTTFIVRTALPYSAQTSGSKQGDFNNDGNTANDRPILCSQKAYTVCPVSSTQINAYKGGAEVGTVVGRDTFRQDGFLNWDMRLIKAFRIKRSQEMQFSAECLNCSEASNKNLGANEVSKFTHAQATMNPLTGYYYSGSNAGVMLNVFDTFRSGGPRQIQLGARYRF